jgi:hypothetical protein
LRRQPPSISARNINERAENRSSGKRFAGDQESRRI